MHLVTISILLLVHLNYVCALGDQVGHSVLTLWVHLTAPVGMEPLFRERLGFVHSLENTAPLINIQTRCHFSSLKLKHLSLFGKKAATG